MKKLIIYTLVFVVAYWAYERYLIPDIPGRKTPPQVQLSVGVLQGEVSALAPGAVFRGVPFAKPPVGPLRWREPVAVESWAGVRMATEFGADCSQQGSRGPGDEDCLYLNVWTPEWPIRNSHPVMLWIFGGANRSNSANNPDFDGAALAAEGVVVVTMNHRVGVMGFLAHPALSAESAHGSSGNYALLDQLMALRWIRDNIREFGGDPQVVTLFGQSSGSYDLQLLMTSPLAQGLFQRAIGQAGQFLSFGGTMDKARAEAMGVAIAADLGAPDGADAIDYLRGLPAEAVMVAAEDRMPTGLDSDTGLLTNVDGWVLPELPARIFADGRQMSIPLIIGNNAREIPMEIPANEIRERIASTYGEFAPRALDAYGLSDGGEGNHDALFGGPGPQWMTDTIQRCAAIMAADWHAQAGNPTWQYQFERSVPGGEARGAYHGADVPFVFGTLSARPDGPVYTDDDRLASERIRGYWTNFAKTANPNGGDLPEWPQAGDGRYMAFTMEGPIVKSGLQAGPCGVYRDWTLERLAGQRAPAMPR